MWLWYGDDGASGGVSGCGRKYLCFMECKHKLWFVDEGGGGRNWGSRLVPMDK